MIGELFPKGLAKELEAAPIAEAHITELKAENERLEKIEAAAVEYVRDSYRPEPKYDAERFDKLVATLPKGTRLEGGDGS